MSIYQINVRIKTVNKETKNWLPSSENRAYLWKDDTLGEKEHHYQLGIITRTRSI